MPSPEAMRAKASRLHEIARDMDSQAEEMSELLSGVSEALDGRIWSGASPRELEERIQTWIQHTETAAQLISDNAQACRDRAGRWDDDADEAELAASQLDPSVDEQVPQ